MVGFDVEVCGDDESTFVCKAYLGLAPPRRTQLRRAIILKNRTSHYRKRLSTSSLDIMAVGSKYSPSGYGAILGAQWITMRREQASLKGQEGPQEEDPGSLCPQRLVRHQSTVNLRRQKVALFRPGSTASNTDPDQVLERPSSTGLPVSRTQTMR